MPSMNQEGSIWAPDLIKHDGRYYIYYPAAGTNWVVTADQITGPWSKPVSIGVGKIDPGHIADDEGRRYVHLSGGHAVEVSPDGLKAVAPAKKIYDGWPIPRDWTIECFCLESPKLTRRGGWYYLTSAQGGTSGPATSHMVVSARSKGPARAVGKLAIQSDHPHVGPRRSLVVQRTRHAGRGPRQVIGIACCTAT